MEILLFTWPFDPNQSATVAGVSYWVGVIGLVITVCGFIYTVRQVRKTESAAKAVEAEVGRVRSSLATYDAVQELARAGYALGATRRYLSAAAWQDVSDSYADVRRILVQLKGTGHIDDESIITEIDAAEQYISKLCTRVEAGLDKPPVSIDIPKTRSVLRKHDDLVAALTAHFQRKII